MTRPVAVLLAGAGSSADFLRRAFAPALTTPHPAGPSTRVRAPDGLTAPPPVPAGVEQPRRARDVDLAAQAPGGGYELVAVAPVPGEMVVERAWAALDEALEAYGPRLRLVGGVSLGAHVAARWASRHVSSLAGGGRHSCWSGAGCVLDGLLLALPAWTGPPSGIAAATGAAADQVDRLGIPGALAAARAGGIDWVADELAAAWPAYGPLLAPTLRAAARFPGPTPAELRSLDLPVGLVAFTDDPLHPLSVARTWATHLPRATLRTLPLTALATARSPLGHTALTALTAADRAPRGPATEKKSAD